MPTPDNKEKCSYCGSTKPSEDTHADSCPFRFDKKECICDGNTVCAFHALSPEQQKIHEDFRNSHSPDSFTEKTLKAFDKFSFLTTPASKLLVLKEEIKDFIRSALNAQREEIRKREVQWLGYFEDIIDDADVLEFSYITEEKPEWLGMIQGLKGAAYMGKNSIEHHLVPNNKDL